MAKEIAYPQMVQRLESIVLELKQANTQIDTAIALFKEGQDLVEKCQAYLNKKTNEIELLQKKEE